MPKEQKPVIAIDLGSSRVRVLAAKPDAAGHMDVTAIGHGPALGVQRGIVTNVDGSTYDPYTPDALAGNAPLHPILLACFRQGPTD